MPWSHLCVIHLQSGSLSERIHTATVFSSTQLQLLAVHKQSSAVVMDELVPSAGVVQYTCRFVCTCHERVFALQLRVPSGSEPNCMLSLRCCHTVKGPCNWLMKLQYISRMGVQIVEALRRENIMKNLKLAFITTGKRFSGGVKQFFFVVLPMFYLCSVFPTYILLLQSCAFIVSHFCYSTG